MALLFLSPLATILTWSKWICDGTYTTQPHIAEHFKIIYFITHIWKVVYHLLFSVKFIFHGAWQADYCACPLHRFLCLVLCKYFYWLLFWASHTVTAWYWYHAKHRWDHQHSTDWAWHLWTEQTTIFALVEDNCSMNHSISMKSINTLLECVSHHYQFVVKIVLMKGNDTIGQVQGPTITLCTPLLSTMHRRDAHLKPKLKNGTSWSFVKYYDNALRCESVFQT